MTLESLPFHEVLHAVALLGQRVDGQLLLIGATARDIALQAEGHDSALRATNDVDIAVAVADMDAFRVITRGLNKPPPGNTDHKFLVAGSVVDIVPFGGVEAEDRTIRWPDGTLMNTLGLNEALGSAILLELEDGLTLKVASLPALAALKVLAWADRHEWTSRDAVDLRALMSAYSDGDRLDAVYAEQNFAMLASYDYDVGCAGVYLLGVAIHNDLGLAVADACLNVVTNSDALAAAMQGDFATAQRRLAAFSDGLQAELNMQA